MATVAVADRNTGHIDLSIAQTGNGDSTNIVDRGTLRIGKPGSVVITSAIGATPTVTVNLQGSSDGINWYNVPYALVATPTTFVIAALVITTAVTTHYLLQVDQPWRYLKLAYTSNTNVTVTAFADL
jgi:hypothetical protein